MVDCLVKPLDIRRLKKWVVKYLPLGSKLRGVILLEEDSLTPSDYLVKLDVWIKLYNIEKASD